MDSTNLAKDAPVAINFSLPQALDAHFKAEAKARLTSKSAVMREALLAHARSRGFKGEVAAVPVEQVAVEM